MANLPLIRARNALADGFQRDAAELAGPLVAGGDPFTVRLAQWLGRFFTLIRQGVTGGFLLGRGTRTLDDPGRSLVETLVNVQHDYARNFAADLRAAVEAGGALSEPAIAARSGLYAGGSIVHPFHAGEAERWNVSLDHYPGDGSTICMGNCRCVLDFQDDGQIVRVFWRAQDDGKVCETCSQRETDWNPLILTQKEAA